MHAIWGVHLWLFVAEYQPLADFFAFLWLIAARPFGEFGDLVNERRLPA
jgi:hypothetical protein